MRYSIEMLVRRVIATLQHPIPSSFHVLPRFCSSSASPSSKLFVGGLSYSVDEQSLKDAFSSFGYIEEVRIAYDKGSGRSRGFGFVDFVEKDDALSAKHAMDGKGLLGRPLRIGFALERVRGGPVVVQRFGKPKSDREKVFK
ncbi:RNA-binding (RRM/RBD/RNP motifs) family protein [Raphanus sativus]|uniref:Glycine-rich RNA-binding protein 4, mitochondrial n=1 Tax=Raphanus sativus TaxID=3726 RepID=A0A6J0NPE1_RAPSA|nr:glycine-rich RNA-binding protein 4, mitochondrial [Raphanus sativus]KAJ4893144.1 RNA-binding (RRM/RBD/RNP motifs) family protein [Raphanus sativus]